MAFVESFKEALLQFSRGVCLSCGGEVGFPELVSSKHRCPIPHCEVKLQYREGMEDFYCHKHRESWSARIRRCNSCWEYWSFSKAFALAEDFPSGGAGASHLGRIHRRW